MRWSERLTPSQLNQCLEYLVYLDDAGFFKALEAELTESTVNAITASDPNQGLARIIECKAQLELLTRIQAESSELELSTDSRNGDNNA